MNVVNDALMKGVIFGDGGDEHRYECLGWLQHYAGITEMTGVYEQLYLGNG